MSNPQPFTITSLSLPDGSCFQTPQQTLDLFVRYMAVYWNEQYSLFNYGNTVPGPDDQLKPWVRLNTDGKIDRLYSFANGNWIAPHPLFSNFTCMWHVSDATAAAGIATLDGGNTNPVSATDGPFWEIVTTLGGRFPVGAGTGYSGVSTFPSLSIGGEEAHALTFPELAGFTAPITGGSVPGAAGTTPGIAPVITPTGVAGTPHNNTPAYFCLYFIKRTARLYYLAS